MEAFVSFVPLLIILVIQLAFAIPICKRKGVGIGWIVLCILPFLGTLFLIVVASKTDEAILQEISELKAAMNKE